MSPSAVHLGRGLLIGQAVDQTHKCGKTTDIYDISDCTQPVLKFSGVIQISTCAYR